MTNYLDLPRLRDERLPFTCELNFTAVGGIHGDIIQVCAFQTFSYQISIKIMILTNMKSTLYGALPISPDCPTRQYRFIGSTMVLCELPVLVYFTYHVNRV